ncbi:MULTISPECIES: acyl carrier protein [unclassified Flavobacterium]|uniref:acyl carrier protein n=1 Tax=unclassified Flavobacterium TaxID=196869 RepID=UPI000F835DA4|nr:MULTISPECIES: acyl carrier protein [unclassified Flavobacterium]RTY74261.1 acyl carrier protein [Flavobacterium sp. LS1R10]TDE51286.1 acyl carrier protein [Flavobacterium sp. GT3P67]
MNYEKLRNSFSEALDLEIEAITNDLAYQSIVEWDSISHMILISQIEEDFDISLETDDVIEMSSVEKAQEILAKHGIKF